MQGKLPTNKFMGSSDGADDDGNINAILTDTGTTLENRLIAIEADTDVIDDGTSGLVKIAQDVAATLADTGTDGVVLANNAIAAAKVAATALDNIVMSDLGAGAPSATASIVAAVNYLYEAWRNKTETTASEIAVYKDDGSTNRDKRTSAANLPFMVLLPNPDSRITPDDKMMVAGEYSLAGWSSPNSTTDVSDPVGGGYWTNPDNAIDGNTGTYAEETSGAALRAIQFNFDEPYPQVMKIRVWAADKPAGAEENADVDIDYQVAGGETFYALFDGALTKAVWNEKQMPTGGVYYPWTIETMWL
ncbi:MAG: hypothetical protein ACYS30_26015 [Planctomycetota bacterium]|jgi:hypothetical protein